MLIQQITTEPEFYAGWGTPNQHPLQQLTTHDLSRHAFAVGSMAPKVLAACAFADRTGKPATIGALQDIEARKKQGEAERAKFKGKKDEGYTETPAEKKRKEREIASGNSFRVVRSSTLMVVSSEPEAAKPYNSLSPAGETRKKAME